MEDDSHFPLCPHTISSSSPSSICSVHLLEPSSLTSISRIAQRHRLCSIFLHLRLHSSSHVSDGWRGCGSTSCLSSSSCSFHLSSILLHLRRFLLSFPVSMLFPFLFLKNCNTKICPSEKPNEPFQNEPKLYPIIGQ